MEPLRVGLWSGFYYPSIGRRNGLWKAAKRIFLREKIKFSIFAGGLVDKETLKQELRLLIRIERMKEKDERRTDEEVNEAFYEKHAEYLAKHFPVLGVKTYLVTSPGYEGEIGKQIGRRLAEKRSDIHHYHGHKLLPLKLPIQKHLGVYTDEVGPTFRSKYYDTPIMRALEDQWKAGENRMGDLNIVAPFGSSVFNPGAAREVKRPYVSLPMLSKPRRVRTSENQFGVRILEINSANLKESLVTTYSFKDMVSKEGSLSLPPARATEVQKAIVSAIGQSGSMTIGQLEEVIGQKREVISKEATALCEKKAGKKWPGLHFDEAQKEYGFEKKWFQERLRYLLPKAGDLLLEDVFLAFGCLHAMCRWSDMLWFRDEVSKLCIAQGVKYLVGAGDFIEGMKHDLMNKGEIQMGTRGVPNYSYHEEAAAYLVGSVIDQVFQHRIREFLEIAKAMREKGKEVKREEALRQLEEALLNFLFRSGNHCGWVAPLGFDSLGTFIPALRKMLFDRVSDTLAELGIILDRRTLQELIARKMVNFTEKPASSHELPSKLRVSIYHPEMGNTITPSIRPQQVLGFSSEPIVFSANFHSAESVEEWNYDLGQRACLQVGTNKIKSGFEEGKLKIVDFGVGLLKVSRLPDGHIWKTQTAFFGEKKAEDKLAIDNQKFVDDFEAYRKKSRES